MGIPTIDISHFYEFEELAEGSQYSDPSTERSKAINALLASISTHGAFKITGHGILGSTIQRVFESSAEFFDLHRHIKKSAVRPRLKNGRLRGYRGPESVDRDSSVSRHKHDCYELLVTRRTDSNTMAGGSARRNPPDEDAAVLSRLRQLASRSAPHPGRGARAVGERAGFAMALGGRRGALRSPPHTKPHHLLGGTFGGSCVTYGGPRCSDNAVTGLPR
ncbi:hypothetical protein PG985_013723 [Apiospora marii]|uniref:uncharacterized protein n=1 Tax=Apiospora marii TaxID=335849 RepID=UPI003131FCEC